MQKEKPRLAAFYIRGFNPPFIEGYLTMANSYISALANFGWNVLVFNFAYSRLCYNDDIHGFHTGSTVRLQQFHLPLMQRDALVQSGSVQIFLSSVAEAALMPAFLLREMANKVRVSHIMNCLKLPRVLARRLMKAKLVLHVYQTHFWGKSLHKLSRNADAIVVSSRRVKDAVAKNLGYPPEQILQLYPFVSTGLQSIPKPRAKAVLGLPTDSLVMLYLGNLGAGRFPDIMIGIFNNIVRAADRDVFFLVFAPLTRENVARRHQLEVLSRRLQVADKVRISTIDLSSAQKMIAYSSADVFVFPCVADGRVAIEPPLTVAEAMNLGVPVVGTNTCSLDEVVDGRNGVLVDVQGIELIGEHVLAILNSTDKRQPSWSSNARQTAIKLFSSDMLSRRFVQFNEELG